MKLRPLDGTVCYWSKCWEPPTTKEGLCAAHDKGCKCRGPQHFPGELCDDNLNASGICSACVDECEPAKIPAKEKQ